MSVEILLEGVTRRFGSADVPILRNLDLHVQAGQSVALVGPSGAGKSTILDVVALLSEVEAGRVAIGGIDRTTADVGSLPMAYIFQRDALLPNETVIENVLMGVRCRGPVEQSHKQRGLSYLDRFGLKGYEHAYPDMLSGGQRQLVAIAQNLMVTPEILVMDEPFASLDFQTRLLMEEVMLSVLAGYEFRRGTQRGDSGGVRPTMLLVTHDIEEALVLADRVVVLVRPEGESAQIILDLPVPHPPGLYRDPIKSRELPAARELFHQIWMACRPYVLQRSRP